MELSLSKEKEINLKKKKNMLFSIMVDYMIYILKIVNLLQINCGSWENPLTISGLAGFPENSEPCRLLTDAIIIIIRQ